MSNTIVKLKETINNVTTDVIKGLKVDTTVVNMQMDVGCDLNVYNEAVRLCNLVKEEYKLANKLFDKEKIPVCKACSFNDLNQDVIVSIKSQDIENNTIANSIKDGLTSKLNEEIIHQSTKSKADSMTVIRDVVQKNLTTELINNSIKNFSLDQTMIISNMQAKNINQIMVATIISNTIINNLIATSTAFNSAIKILDGPDIIPTTSIASTTPAILTPNIVEVKNTDYTYYYIFMILIICIVLYGYFSKGRPKRRKHKQRRYN